MMFIERKKMNLNNLIKKQIQELSDIIDFRDDNEEWLNTIRGIDTNEYFWRHCGEKAYYKGKLSALRGLLK